MDVCCRPVDPKWPTRSGPVRMDPVTIQPRAASVRCTGSGAMLLCLWMFAAPLAAQEPPAASGAPARWLVSAGAELSLADAGAVGAWSGRWSTAPVLGIEVGAAPLRQLPIGFRVQLTGVLAPRVRLRTNGCTQPASAGACPSTETGNVDAIVSPELGLTLIALTSSLGEVALTAGGGFSVVLGTAAKDCLSPDPLCEARYAFTETRASPALHAGLLLDRPVGFRPLRLEVMDRLVPRVGRDGFAQKLDLALAVRIH